MKAGGRQVYRLKNACLEGGDEKLNHGLTGRQGSHSKAIDFKQTVLNLYQERYADFGPTFASEMMKEEFGIEINCETLRLWLKKAGLWTAKRE